MAELAGHDGGHPARYAILAVLGILLVVASAQFIAMLPEYADELQATAQGGARVAAVARVLERGSGYCCVGDRPRAADLVAAAVADAVLGAATAFFFVLAYVLFMAADASRFSRGSNVFGGVLADAIGTRYFSGVRRYYVVNASFGAVVAVLDGLVLWALGIPVPITWAILAFVTNFIPTSGS
jgi:predicted PurR-regulated permease PerM